MRRDSARLEAKKKPTKADKADISRLKGLISDRDTQIGYATKRREGFTTAVGDFSQRATAQQASIDDYDRQAFDQGQDVQRLGIDITQLQHDRAAITGTTARVAAADTTTTAESAPATSPRPQTSSTSPRSSRRSAKRSAARASRSASRASSCRSSAPSRRAPFTSRNKPRIGSRGRVDHPRWRHAALRAGQHADGRSSQLRRRRCLARELRQGQGRRRRRADLDRAGPPGRPARTGAASMRISLDSWRSARVYRARVHVPAVGAAVRAPIQCPSRFP